MDADPQADSESGPAVRDHLRLAARGVPGADGVRGGAVLRRDPRGS